MELKGKSGSTKQGRLCVDVKQVNIVEKLLNCEALTKTKGGRDETRHEGFIRHLKRSQQC